MPLSWLKTRLLTTGGDNTRKDSNQDPLGLVIQSFQFSRLVSRRNGPNKTSRLPALPVELIFEIFEMAAASDRRLARTLMRVSKQAKVITSPHFYRIIILLDARALYGFVRLIESDDAVAPRVEHIWIGPRKLNDKEAFYPTNNYHLTTIRRLVDLDASVAVESVLSRCPNLLSLALPPWLDKFYGGIFAFRLIEYITEGNHKYFQWAKYPSIESIQRAVFISGFTDQQTGESIRQLPNFKRLELIWVEAPSVLSMQRFLRSVLESRVVEEVVVRSTTGILHAMYQRLPVQDGRLKLGNLAFPACVEDGGFVLDEWESRTRKAELWVR